MTSLLLIVALLVHAPVASKSPCRGPILWTFDDGPSRRSAPHLLRLIREYHLGTTVWFVLGGVLQDPRNVRALRAVVADGHELGNHLWTHYSPCKLGRRGVLRELRRTDRWLRRLVPQAKILRWYRPPFGARCYSRTVMRLGYRVVLWHAGDIGATPGTMFRWIWRRTIRGLPTIVLVHHNWRKFRALLQLLRARGCLAGGEHGTQ